MDNFDILPVFSSPIIRTIVNENTEELKENSYKLRGSGDRSSVDRRVLEKHPKIRDILIKNFNGDTNSTCIGLLRILASL